MATLSRDITVKFQTTKDGDVEETHFRTGDSIAIVQEWTHFFLIKDADGHFYNVPKDSINPA